MNAALAAGCHLSLTPGVHPLAGPIRLTRPATVVLGLGPATLVATDGRAAVTVADVSGVTMAGLLIDAGPVRSPVLVEIGPRGSRRDRCAAPTPLADLFFRVGSAAVGNGEHGRTFFYQNELRYDPPSQAAYGSGARHGWAAYSRTARRDPPNAHPLPVIVNVLTLCHTGSEQGRME